MRLKERGDGVQAEFEESMKNRLEQGFLLPGQTALLTPAKHVLAAFERGQVAALSSLEQPPSRLYGGKQLCSKCSEHEHLP